MTVVEQPVALFAADALQDPYPLYERMRAAGPVYRIGDSQFYAVCGWDAVVDAVSRPEDFSSNLTATMTCTRDGIVKAFEMDPLGGPTHVLATADDPAHAVHRKLLVRHLAARRIRAMEEFATQTADRLLADGLRNGRIEWMGAVANRLPMMVVAQLIGVPATDVAQLVKWGYAATQLLEGLVDQDQLATAGAAVLELSGYIAERFGGAAADPQDNLIGELATACAAGELDMITAQVMMVTLFAAGGESTASLLGSAAWVLAHRPDIQQQVREKPELLTSFIEETLRYEAPFRGHYRHVRGHPKVAAATASASRIGGHVVDAEVRAPPASASTQVAIVPGRRWSAAAARRCKAARAAMRPRNVLRDVPTMTGRPSATSSGRRQQQLEVVLLALAEADPGVERDPPLVDTGGDGVLEALGEEGLDLVDHVVVRVRAHSGGCIVRGSPRMCIREHSTPLAATTSNVHRGVAA